MLRALFAAVLVAAAATLPSQAAPSFYGSQLLPSASSSSYAIASSGSIVATGMPQCAWAVPATGASTMPAGSAFTGNGYVQMYSCPTAATCVLLPTVLAPVATDSGFTQSCFGLSVALTNSGQFLAVGAPMYRYDSIRDYPHSVNSERKIVLFIY